MGVMMYPERSEPMILNQLDYLLKESITGLKRAGWMNGAAVGVLTILLYLFGLGWQMVWQMEQAMTSLGAQLEISVYLKPDAEVAPLMTRATRLVGVDQVTLTTRAQAWASLQKEGVVPQDLPAMVGENPLVDVVHVHVHSPERVAPLAQQIQGWTGVDGVRYGNEAAERLGDLKQILSWFGLALVLLLAGATVAVIMTAIGLVVAARQREIEVMQLVGASPAWVYTPFILEGVILGIVGATCAWSLINLTKEFLSQQINQYLPFISFSDAAPTPWHLPLILVGSGLLLGSSSSWLAVTRYLRR
jgi:cell division transport system permease protein